MDKCANIYRLGVKELRILLRDPVLILLIIWAFSGGIYSVATTTIHGITQRANRRRRRGSIPAVRAHHRRILRAVF